MVSLEQKINILVRATILPDVVGGGRDAQGQRASKTTGGIIIYFVYSDLDGQLLGEYNASGQPIREYIYLEGERVAMYDYNTVEPKDSSGSKQVVYLANNQVGQVVVQQEPEATDDVV